MQEKRKNSRINVSFPVECKSLPSRKYHYTVSKDLSVGGARIISNDLIAKNTLLKISINLIKNVLDLTARVAWCSKERFSERYLAGLEFTEMNIATQKTLLSLINGTTGNS